MIGLFCTALASYTPGGLELRRTISRVFCINSAPEEINGVNILYTAASGDGSGDKWTSVSSIIYSPSNVAIYIYGFWWYTTIPSGDVFECAWKIANRVTRLLTHTSECVIIYTIYYVTWICIYIRAHWSILGAHCARIVARNSCILFEYIEQLYIR